MLSLLRSIWLTRRFKNMFLLAIGVAMWLCPFFWVGSRLGRLPVRVPERLWQQYSASALFTQRVPAWSDWRIEVRQTDTTEWRVLEMTKISPMPTSGYRQRIDRILGDTRSKKIAESLRQRLAEWIAQRLREQTGQEIGGLRYLYRAWQTNTPELACAEGHWDGDGLLPPTTRVSILGEYAIVDGKAKPSLAKPQTPNAPPLQPRIFRRQQPPAAGSLPKPEVSPSGQL